MPALRQILEEAPNAILESNAILQFLRPSLYLVVLDFRIADIKDSLRSHFDRADALVITGGAAESAPWPGIPERWLKPKPRFPVAPPSYMSEELAQLVAARLHSGAAF
jgi:hypothetical protein